MSRMSNPEQLWDRFQLGHRGALARLLTQAESDPSSLEPIFPALQSALKWAPRWGITGAGGVGKSTLVDAITQDLRARGTSVGILATDPTSEISGGALLGDRVRFSAMEPDDGVFFRSVAHRGARGGLSAAVHDQLDLLDGFGFDQLILEAVGAGQTETDISYAVDLVLVVFSPEAGDAVQAMKAGLMEVGDLYCISKADLGGAERAKETLEAALALRRGAQASVSAESSQPPVLTVSAIQQPGSIVCSGDVVSNLVSTAIRRFDQLNQSGELQRRRAQRKVRRVRAAALRLLEQRLLTEEVVADLVRRSEERAPARLAEDLVAGLMPPESS